MWRWLVSVLLGSLCVIMLSVPAHAGEQWCEDDPLVMITTPGGAIVPVYVTNGGLGVEHLPAVQLAHISYTAQSAGTSTLVRMAVIVPDDLVDSHFDTRTAVSTGPFQTGTVFSTATGNSGNAMYMQFTLAVS